MNVLRVPDLKLVDGLGPEAEYVDDWRPVFVIVEDDSRGPLHRDVELQKRPNLEEIRDKV